MMNRRMMKILVLGALMMALPAMALAQTSRVEGMALQGDFIKDVSGMFTYTSQVANVGNTTATSIAVCVVTGIFGLLTVMFSNKPH